MVGLVLPASILWRTLSFIPELEASDAWVNLKRLKIHIFVYRQFFKAHCLHNYT